MLSLVPPWLSWSPFAGVAPSPPRVSDGHQSTDQQHDDDRSGRHQQPAAPPASRLGEPALVLLPRVTGDRQVVDRPEGRAQVALELVVAVAHRFPSIRAARASRPRETWDFTVPRLMLIASAISASVRSSQ